jgi:hypothetical protein
LAGGQDRVGLQSSPATPLRGCQLRWRRERHERGEVCFVQNLALGWARTVTVAPKRFDMHRDHLAYVLDSGWRQPPIHSFEQLAAVVIWR